MLDISFQYRNIKDSEILFKQLNTVDVNVKEAGLLPR